MSWLSMSVYGEQEVPDLQPNEDFEEVDAPTGFSEPPSSPVVIRPKTPPSSLPPLGSNTSPTPLGSNASLGATASSPSEREQVVPTSPPPRPKVPKVRIERRNREVPKPKSVQVEGIQDLLVAINKLEDHIASLHTEQILVLRAIMNNTRK